LNQIDWTQKVQALLEQAWEDTPAELAEEIVQEDPPSLPSQYDLWSSLTVLGQEIKLQSRAFKGLEEALNSAPQGEALELARETAEKAWSVSQQRLQEARREGEERVREEMILALLEAHDRLARGLESAQSTRRALPASRPWWRGGGADWGQAVECVDSLVDGSRLGLESLKAMLDRYEVSEVTALGKPFDPHTMNAVSLEARPGTAEGTVLEVVRAGYFHNSKLLRVAQVKVSR